MKEIIESIDGMNEFQNLRVGENFEYVARFGNTRFKAKKISAEKAAFKNGWGKYIIATAYTNCLDIGQTSREYDTIAELTADVVNSPVLQLRKRTRLSQAAFAQRYGIPKRTIENWEEGKRSVPTYVLDLLTRCVENDISRDYNKHQIDKLVNFKHNLDIIEEEDLEDEDFLSFFDNMTEELSRIKVDGISNSFLDQLWNDSWDGETTIPEVVMDHHYNYINTILSIIE